MEEEEEEEEEEKQLAAKVATPAPKPAPAEYIAQHGDGDGVTPAQRQKPPYDWYAGNNWDQDTKQWVAAEPSIVEGKTVLKVLPKPSFFNDPVSAVEIML